MSHQKIVCVLVESTILCCSAVPFAESVIIVLHTLIIGLIVDDEISDFADTKDNRELLDSMENQLLSKDEIHSLRMQGVTGEASC